MLVLLHPYVDNFIMLFLYLFLIFNFYSLSHTLLPRRMPKKNQKNQTSTAM